MSKKNKTPLGIFIESIGLYFSNFDKFIKYMTFPVLGQIVGLVIVFLLANFYSQNIAKIIDNIPALNSYPILFTVLLLIILPGLIIFMKAFWEYLVAYGAINSMLENLLKSKKVYDFDAHNELIKRRSVPFVGLWLLVGIFSLCSVIPLLWVPAGVLAVFFVLIFQVFTYEPELSPLGCVKKSMQLIKGHFASTFMLLALSGALTYVLIPQLMNKVCEYLKLTGFLSSLLIPTIDKLPLYEINNILLSVSSEPLESRMITLIIVTLIISQIIIQYTLPMRSILWGMWYRELNGGKLFAIKEEKFRKKSYKKPSEKLMDASNKKYSSKKIDRNILKRAMEKDD